MSHEVEQVYYLPETTMTDGVAQGGDDKSAVQIGVGDVQFIGVGAAKVIGACKNAFRLNSALDIDKGEGGGQTAQHRESQAEALQGLIEELPENTALIIPGHLVRAARIGVALHLGEVETLKESEQTKLFKVPTETEKRIKQLNRILNTLDGQGDLGIKDE